MALLCMGIVLVTALLGIFAPWVAPNDPYANDILNKFDSPSWQYPLGTDHLGRCVFSRMLFGIRPTLFLSLLTMLGTIGLGVIMGITAGYFRGTVDEVIMRVVDVMLSFPSQIIILAVVALLGVDIRNVVIASIFIKWAWYARMIRTATIKYTGMNFVLFSRSIGSGNFYILTRHMLPCIAAELAVLASLDTGWAILNISTLSFLGLGVQAPVPEWGAMLNEAKNVMVSNPEQMIVPGIAVVVLVGAFNMLGDCLRDDNVQVTGSSRFEGRPLLSQTPEQLRRLRGGKISMVLQNPMSCFDPLYRIGEQMAETLQEHTSLKGRPLQKRMEDILCLMRIHDPADVLRKYPHQLSGGMLQRVMIGLAICMQPSLIIADEPTTAIDSISQYAIMQEFLRIKQRGEVSMIFISHDLGVLSLIADRLIVMHDGKAVESGTAQEIFDNATDTYTRHLIKQHRAVMHRFLDALHAPVPGRIPA